MKRLEVGAVAEDSWCGSALHAVLPCKFALIGEADAEPQKITKSVRWGVPKMHSGAKWARERVSTFH